MKKYCLLIALTVALSATPDASVAQDDVKSVKRTLVKRIEELDRELDRRLRDIKGQYAAKFSDLQAAAVDDLAQLQKEAMADQKLDKAIACRDASKVVKDMDFNDSASRNAKAEIARLERSNISGATNARYIWKSVAWTFADDGMIHQHNGKADVNNSKWAISNEGKLIILSNKGKLTATYSSIATPTGIYAIKDGGAEAIWIPLQK